MGNVTKLFGEDTAELLGEEDDSGEYTELGIDYGLSDPDVMREMGTGRAPKVVMNPHSPNKVIHKRIQNAVYDRPNGILVVDFMDGSRLTIKE